MSVNLPDGWAEVALQDVCSGVSQRGPSPQSDTFKYIDLGAIDNKAKRIANASSVPTANAPSRAKQVVATGDVLFSTVRVYLENLALVPAELDGAVASTAFTALRPSLAIDPRYLYQLVSANQFIRSVDALQRGNSPPSVQDKDVRGQRVPLPPYPEQQRIVSRIEELFSEIDEGERALERVRKLLERYRQSALKAAVTGELTREWRAGTPLIFDASSVEGQHALPPGWVWRSLDELAWATSYGTSAKCSTSGEGIPVLRIPNVRAGRIALEELKWAPAQLDLANEDMLAPGDLLVVRTNGSESLIGVGTVVLEPFEKPSYFASYLIRFRLKREPYLAEWVNLVWQSDVVRRFVHKHKATSAGQYNISQSKLRALRLPLPPESERKALLDAWQIISSRMAATLREAKLGSTGAVALRQSVLKAAFSGQLVPQDPTDEPASALLARLAAQANDTPSAARRRGRPTTGTRP